LAARGGGPVSSAGVFTRDGGTRGKTNDSATGSWLNEGAAGASGKESSAARAWDSFFEVDPWRIPAVARPTAFEEAPATQPGPSWLYEPLEQKPPCGSFREPKAVGKGSGDAQPAQRGPLPSIDDDLAALERAIGALCSL
jgi:hypothetical protein